MQASEGVVNEARPGAITFRSEPPPAPNNPARNAALLGVGLLLSVAVAFYAWSTAGAAELKVGGVDISNASQMLIDAEAIMGEAAWVDGATLRNEQRCYFAPASYDDGPPTIVCGPIWFGTTPPEEPWLVVETAFTATDDEVIGEIGSISSTTDANPRKFRRPDGVDPADVGAPTYPSTRLRLGAGTQLVNPVGLIIRSEVALRDEIALNEAGAESELIDLVFAEDWQCFLVQGPDRVHGVIITDGDPLCGPARSVGSAVDAIWLPVSVAFEQGPTFGTRQIETARLYSQGLRPIPEGAMLMRPDGRPPADASNVNRPPVPSGFATAVGFQVALESSATGLLITENDRFEFATLARTKQAGVGAQSFRAPEGQDLVIVGIDPRDRRYSLRGVLVIDGVEQPLPILPDLANGAMIVVAVSEQTSSVELLIENDGRPQSISLLDGSLGPGFPLALYRPATKQTLPFVSRITMPVGESVIIEGDLAAVNWSARGEDQEWLPEGVSQLSIDIPEWAVDRPCCDVSIDSIDSAFTLIASGGDPGDIGETYEDLRQNSLQPPSTWDSPRFRVPEDIDGATLRVDISVTYQIGDEAQTATDTLEFDLDLD